MTISFDPETSTKLRTRFTLPSSGKASKLPVIVTVDPKAPAGIVKPLIVYWSVVAVEDGSTSTEIVLSLSVLVLTKTSTVIDAPSVGVGTKIELAENLANVWPFSLSNTIFSSSQEIKANSTAIIKIYFFHNYTSF